MKNQKYTNWFKSSFRSILKRELNPVAISRKAFNSSGDTCTAVSNLKRIVHLISLLFCFNKYSYAKKAIQLFSQIISSGYLNF